MFTVPGWSVSGSALKAQTEQSQTQPQRANGTPKPKDKNNKRKRDDHVTKANVGEMYRRHIEGQTDKPKPWNKGLNNSIKPEKKQKKEQNVQGNAEKRPSVSQGEDESKLDKQMKPDIGEGKKADKKQKKNKNKQQQQETQNGTTEKTTKEASATTESLLHAPPKTEAILTPLQQAMRQKLISSRFRHLNETLYTTPSSKALELFTASPELFDEYHAGFSRQVKESWPLNPVDGYIQTIRSRAKVPAAPRRGDKNDSKSRIPLPRRPNGNCTIADLGCGDAQLARTLIPSAKKLKLNLLSYDLHAPEGSPITKADVSNLPVDDGTVDVAIFCLSLMGTNWVSFVEEAWRVLRGDGKGECWVSEVKSRFGKVVRKKAQIGARKPMSKSEKKKLKKKRGGDDADSDLDDAEVYAEDARPTDDDETDISAFIEVFRTRGFFLKPESVDKSNKMFVKMVFVKQGAPTKGKHVSAVGTKPGPGKKRFIEKPIDAGNSMSPEEEAAVLKPCVYKIR
ncbi:25S rRNA (adenine645-N1)-methyltransferase [Aspergillus alliaceus]|uniref:25S rRNA (adenine645-N1)-methyltransferase n=1 Tax=Petromyces alliaceus TaxID=209559 RepID=UPI0012A66432|nr:methyltransferase-domain-containing protein [Aspergillus alliaceus]KAB8235336.1 methyltransferase-domain-containing protein [Aspergillus alliaceus]